MTDASARARRTLLARFVAREVVLWAGAIVGVVCLTAAALGVFAGITPLIFRSGSMSPGIPTGALALAHRVPASEVVPGDVVGLTRADGQLVTHRVVAIDASTADPAQRAFTLRGDANRAADPEPIVAATADRVFWSAPSLGFALDEAMKPQYVFVVGTLFGMLAMIGFRRPRLDDDLASSPPEVDDVVAASPGSPARHTAEEARRRTLTTARSDHDPGPRHAAGRHRPRRRDVRGSGHRASGAISLIVVAAVAGSSALATPHPTLAAFADTGSVTSTHVAGTVPTVSTIACSVPPLLAQPLLSWSFNATTTGSVQTAVVVLRDNVAVATLAAGTTSFQIPASLLTLGGTTTWRVQVVAGSWNTVSTGRQVTTIVLNVSASCGGTVA